ncbi:MAG: LytTR family DNA-binding domain-containing protein [Ferruginibacter sp.]
MIRAVHIEDEPRNVELLASLLQTYCYEQVKMTGHASTVDEALVLIKELQPQLIYLDIELNNGNAFELLEKLGEAGISQFQVIFITAFNEYAVKAFRYHALDYLLKPISIEELREATQRAIQRIESSLNSARLMETLRQLNLQLTSSKIAFPTNDGVLFVNSREIIRIEALGSYSAVYLQNKQKITVARPLKDIESSLPESVFWRVHHSWIINLKYLKKYFRGKNGYVEMEDGSTVMVSIRKKGKFLDLF